MSKQALRDYYYQERLVLTDKFVDTESNKIGKLLVEWMKQFTTISKVHSFLPIASKKEVDTFDILQQISEHYPDISLVIPRIAKGHRQMKHYLYSASTNIILNRWGIPEPDPSSTIEVPAKTVDLVLTPLLIFDKKGNRVGYGGGYYDAFFSDCKPNVIKMGLSLFEPIEEIEGIDEFDIPLDYCITPNQIWSFNKKG